MQATNDPGKPSKAQSAEVRVLGQRIVLRSSETDPELVDETVELVSRLLKNAELRSRGKTVAPHQVAVLALMDIAEEYLRAKRRTTMYRRRLDEKVQQLTELIEDKLK